MLKFIVNFKKSLLENINDIWQGLLQELLDHNHKEYKQVIEDYARTIFPGLTSCRSEHSCLSHWVSVYLEMGDDSLDFDFSLEYADIKDKQDLLRFLFCDFDVTLERYILKTLKETYLIYDLKRFYG